MTKINENSSFMNNPERVHKELEESALKFSNALQSYQTCANSDEKVRLKAIMDEQLGLIKQAVAEIKFKEIHKQEEKVETDYRMFSATESEQAYASLAHDLQTLRDYNKISELNHKPQEN